MRGRRPVPSELKILRGNPGHRPINAREPRPRAAIPRCPKHLDDEAKRAWRRITRQLHRAGILTEIDRDALAIYCQAWSRYLQAEENLQRYGPVLVSKEKQWPMLSPYLIMANQAIKQMYQFLVEFGMTPSSRTRVVAQHSAPSPIMSRVRA